MQRPSMRHSSSSPAKDIHGSTDHSAAASSASHAGGDPGARALAIGAHPNGFEKVSSIVESDKIATYLGQDARGDSQLIDVDQVWSYFRINFGYENRLIDNALTAMRRLVQTHPDFQRRMQHDCKTLEDIFLAQRYKLDQRYKGNNPIRDHLKEAQTLLGQIGTEDQTEQQEAQQVVHTLLYTVLTIINPKDESIQALEGTLQAAPMAGQEESQNSFDALRTRLSHTLSQFTDLKLTLDDLSQQIDYAQCLQQLEEYVDKVVQDEACQQDSRYLKMLTMSLLAHECCVSEDMTSKHLHLDDRGYRASLSPINSAGESQKIFVDEDYTHPLRDYQASLSQLMSHRSDAEAPDSAASSIQSPDPEAAEAPDQKAAATVIQRHARGHTVRTQQKFNQDKEQSIQQLDTLTERLTQIKQAQICLHTTLTQKRASGAAEPEPEAESEDTAGSDSIINQPLVDALKEVISELENILSGLAEQRESLTRLTLKDSPKAIQGACEETIQKLAELQAAYDLGLDAFQQRLATTMFTKVASLPADSSAEQHKIQPTVLGRLTVQSMHAGKCFLQGCDIFKSNAIKSGILGRSYGMMRSAIYHQVLSLSLEESELRPMHTLPYQIGQDGVVTYHTDFAPTEAHIACIQLIDQYLYAQFQLKDASEADKAVHTEKFQEEARALGITEKILKNVENALSDEVMIALAQSPSSPDATLSTLRALSSSTPPEKFTSPRLGWDIAFTPPDIKQNITALKQSLETIFQKTDGLHEISEDTQLALIHSLINGEALTLQNITQNTEAWQSFCRTNHIEPRQSKAIITAFSTTSVELNQFKDNLTPLMSRMEATEMRVDGKIEGSYGGGIRLLGPAQIYACSREPLDARACALFSPTEDSLAQSLSETLNTIESFVARHPNLLIPMDCNVGKFSEQLKLYYQHCMQVHREGEKRPHTSLAVLLDECNASADSLDVPLERFSEQILYLDCMIALQQSDPAGFELIECALIHMSWPKQTESADPKKWHHFQAIAHDQSQDSTLPKQSGADEQNIQMLLQSFRDIFTNTEALQDIDIETQSRLLDGLLLSTDDTDADTDASNEQLAWHPTIELLSTTFLSTADQQAFINAFNPDEASEQLIRFKQELYVLKKTIAAGSLIASSKMMPIPANKLTYTPSSVEISHLLTPGSPEYPPFIQELKNTILDSSSVHTKLQGQNPLLVSMKTPDLFKLSTKASRPMDTALVDSFTLMKSYLTHFLIDHPEFLQVVNCASIDEFPAVFNQYAVLWGAHNQQLLDDGQSQGALLPEDTQNNLVTAIYFLYQSAQQAPDNDRFAAVSSALQGTQPSDLIRVAGGAVSAQERADAPQTPWLDRLPLTHCQAALDSKKYTHDWERKMAAIDLFFTVKRLSGDPGQKDAEEINALTQETHTASAGTSQAMHSTELAAASGGKDTTLRPAPGQPRSTSRTDHTLSPRA